MRHIRSFAVGLMVLAGSAVAANAQATQQKPERPRGEFQKGGVRGLRGPGGPARGLMRGIQLTDAEKASLKTVQQKYQAQFKSIRESMKPQLEAARTARQRGDTVAAKAALEKTSGDRAKLQTLMEQSRTEMRGALTAEHQKQFDENAAKFKDRQGKRGGEGRRHGEHKQGK
jgi:periplasmic protein CpxP/Spy